MTPALFGLPALTVFAFGARHLARAYTTRGPSDIDRYCDQVDEYIRTGRSRYVTHPVDAGLDEDLHWAGVEAEWLRFVHDLPTTRETA